MRKIIALALFVFSHGASLTAGSADPPYIWADLHEKALAAAERQDLPTALDLLTRCRELAKTPLQLGVSAEDLGATLLRMRKTKEAQQWLQQALEIWKSADEQFVRLAQTSVLIAETDRELGEYTQAERLLREALAGTPATEPLPPVDIEARALVLDELGDIMREEGRATESRALLAQVACMPGVSWRRVVDSTLGLAQLDRDTHNWEDSIAGWNHLAEMGHDHADIELEAVAARGLGQTWLDRGNPARAEPLLRSALASFETDPRTYDLQIASTLTSMAQLYIGDNKLAMAEGALLKALRVEESSFGEMHPQVAVVLVMLGDTLARNNRIELAREYLDRAVRIQTAAFGEQSPLTGATLASLGFIEQRTHNAVRAAAIYERALAAFGPHPAPEVEALRISVMQRYADSLKASHHKEEANAVLTQLRNFHAK